MSPVEDPSFVAYTFGGANAGFDGGLSGYARAMPHAYDAPKSWAECTTTVHTQMPIFVNAYAGGTGVYDWCVPHAHYGSCVDAADGAYPYTGEHHDPFGGLGDDYVRVHAGECLPAVAY